MSGVTVDSPAGGESDADRGRDSARRPYMAPFADELRPIVAAGQTGHPMATVPLVAGALPCAAACAVFAPAIPAQWSANLFLHPCR